MVKGYSYNKHSNTWVAEIMVKKQKYFLGSFHKEEDARQAYLDAKINLRPSV